MAKAMIKRTTKKSAVSPVLMTMLGKLATWKPKSNGQVIEVASRLLKAAQDEADSEHTDKELANKACKMLEGHTLSRYNGIGYDHDYVFQAVVDGKVIHLRTLHAFQRNRIAEYAVSTRILDIPVSDLVPEPAGDSVSNRKDWQLVPGYELDAVPAISILEHACEGVVATVQAFLLVAKTSKKPKGRRPFINKIYKI